MIIQGDCLEQMKKLEDNSVDAIVTDPPYGWSFMGKKWDYDIPSVEVWKEALRVLKPGGHALVACGTRTQHRMAVNLEDAGFEIRDLIAWVYGSGFPKSRNITLDMDKREGHPNRGHRIAVANRHHPDGTLEPNGEILPAYSPKTDNAKKWEGWGTALKPAMELWTLCRKPLSEKTVAENCLKWGVGGINIDGCRVGIDKDDDIHAKNPHTVHIKSNLEFTSSNGEAYKVPTGRFPANLIHDGSDEVRECFPETKTGKAIRSNSGGKTFGGENTKPIMEDLGYEDGGGNTSRFFKSIIYTAKASKSERNIGLNGFEKQTITDGRKKDIDNAFQRGKTLRNNNHPTVKPLALMRYLCRLITPPGGTVLDLYMGSGTTGMACKEEGFNFIGIEIEPEYVKIAEARIKAIPERMF